MSTFDIFTDAPGLLRAESINITLKFDRTGPTTGRVSWNIPTPAAGCAAENQAYCGMLITIDTKPAAAGKGPQRGTMYNSDPTVDANLFAGDYIETAMVIGGFYQDRTTTFFDVTGLRANTPYYVTGYPVDCELRYFIEGVHAYSADFKNRGTDGTHGTQVVVLNSNATPMGRQPTDSTGLSLTQSYDFNIQLGVVPRPNRPIDSVECVLTPPTYTITVAGANSQTYEDLVGEINSKFATLANATQSPTPPNAGGYYWNAQVKKLFQWNGHQHVEIPVLYEPSTPTNVIVGTYWYDGTILSMWNGTTWVPTPIIELGNDPTVPLADTSYWFNGTKVFLWNGVTWCDTNAVIGTADPSAAATIVGGSFWYDETTGMFYKWNNELLMWVTTSVIQSSHDPNMLPVGTTWYNEVSGVVQSYNTVSPGWNVETNVAIAEIAPTTPAPGKYWYNPADMEMFRRNDTNTAWVQVDVIVTPFDPTQRASCDLWWDVDTDQLFAWDVLNSVWKLVTAFYTQATDPAAAPTMVDGFTWYNPDTGTLYVWEGNCFVQQTVTYSAADPITSVTPGTAWYNPTTGLWYIRDVSTWLAIDPVNSPSDPRSLASGTFWFNSSNNGLQMWNGAAWMTVMFQTTPYTPATGTLWYDTTSNTLKQWNGIAWVIAAAIATVELDCNGNLLFTDATVGSTSFVNISDGTLFSSLSVVTTIHDPKPGADGASDTPSYMEVGIGTDGSDAIRKALANDIRHELGYPVVNVELTQEQIDYAISRALGVLRQQSGIAYKRGFFFMAIPPNEQRFFLTNKISGMNKIVDVLGVYRMTSAFLASAHGAGVYGQIVLQHLYNMGTFDLLSYHIMGEYTKLMEMLFAARLTYTWNEQTRELWIHNRFPMSEKMVCIEAAVERTEQDIMSDRYVQPWIRKYATAYCRIMLAEIRGKFSTLPGASGSVTLNAAELRQTGQQELQECMDDIDSYVVDKPEEYGIGTQFTFG